MINTQATQWGRRVVIAVFIIAATSALRAEPLDQWHWLNPLPTGESFVDVVFGGDIFVAVDGNGYFWSSSDGRQWTRDRQMVLRPNKIAYAGGQFVAVGEKGSIVSGHPGAWFERSSGTGETLGAIAYGNGTFVAVGAGRTIVRSDDGSHWTAQVLPEVSATFSGVAFGEGRFVAVANTQAWVSTNGVNWSTKTIASAGRSAAVIHAFGRFYTSLESGSLNPIWQFYESVNGLDWILNPQRRYAIRDGVEPSNPFVVSYDFADLPGSVLVSTNGVDWVVTPVNSSASILAVAYGNGIYVAAGTTGMLARSNDGRQWETIRRGYVDELRAMTRGGDRYVIVGETVLSSSNLVDFTRIDGLAIRAGLFFGFLSVDYGSGVFAAAGAGGRIIRSTNGVHWEIATSGTTVPLRGLA